MKINEHQVGTVIKTYLKNRKDKLTTASTFAEGREINDNVHVSDEGKKVLFERMGKHVVEKAKNELSSN